MPNKTITAIIAVTIISVFLALTHAPFELLYLALFIIAALGGLSIWRNTHPPKLGP